jgi:hypothetical protein
MQATSRRLEARLFRGPIRAEYFHFPRWQLLSSLPHAAESRRAGEACACVLKASILWPGERSHARHVTQRGAGPRSPNRDDYVYLIEERVKG